MDITDRETLREREREGGEGTKGEPRIEGTEGVTQERGYRRGDPGVREQKG